MTLCLKMHNWDRYIGRSAHTWSSSSSLMRIVGELVVLVACCYPSSRSFPRVNLSSIFVSIFLLGLLDGAHDVALDLLFVQIRAIEEVSLRLLSQKLICTFDLRNGLARVAIWAGVETFSYLFLWRPTRTTYMSINARASLSAAVTHRQRYPRPEETSSQRVTTTSFSAGSGPACLLTFLL